MNSMNSSQRRRSAQIGARRNDARGFQIGPRIRIGGSVGHAAQHAKEAVGKDLSNKWVDMGLSLIPGVGPGLAALANTAGHVMDTTGGGIHTGGDIWNIAKDAGTVYGGAKVLGGIKGMMGSKVPMGERLKGLIHGGGVDGKGSMGVAGDMYGRATGSGGLPPGDDGNFIDSLVQSGKGAMGGGLMDKALMAGAVAAAAADRQKQSQMMDEAKGYATTSYNNRAPLRERALASFKDPHSAMNESPDLSSIFSNPGSAYNKIGPRVPVTVQ